MRLIIISALQRRFQCSTQTALTVSSLLARSALGDLDSRKVDGDRLLELLNTVGTISNKSDQLLGGSQLELGDVVLVLLDDNLLNLGVEGLLLADNLQKSLQILDFLRHYALDRSMLNKYNNE